MDGWTNGRTDRRTDEWTDGQTDETERTGPTDERTDETGRTDGQTDGRTDGWKDGRTDVCTAVPSRLAFMFEKSIILFSIRGSKDNGVHWRTVDPTYRRLTLRRVVPMRPYKRPHRRTIRLQCLSAFRLPLSVRLTVCLSALVDVVHEFRI